MLVARIKLAIEKIFDKDTSLADIIRILFREQRITVISVLTALSMTISTNILAITDISGGGGVSVAFPQKDEGVLKKRPKRLAHALKRLAGKAVEVLPAIDRGVASGFVSEHTWSLIVFVPGLNGVRLI